MARTPEAAGFAAALSSYLAQGGGVRGNPKSRKAGLRFTEGKVKGKTVEQATERAKQLWMGASPAVRAKYEAQGARLMSDGEQQAAQQQRTPAPQGVTGRAWADQDPALGGVGYAAPTPTAPAAAGARPARGNYVPNPGGFMPNSVPGDRTGRARTGPARGYAAPTPPVPAVPVTKTATPATAGIEGATGPAGMAGMAGAGSSGVTGPSRAALGAGIERGSAERRGRMDAAGVGTSTAAGPPASAKSANEYVGPESPGAGWTMVGAKKGGKLWRRDDYVYERSGGGPVTVGDAGTTGYGPPSPGTATTQRTLNESAARQTATNAAVARAPRGIVVDERAEGMAAEKARRDAETERIVAKGAGRKVAARGVKDIYSNNYSPLAPQGIFDLRRRRG